MEIHIREICREDAESVNALTLQLGYTLTLSDTTNQINEVLLSADNSAFVAITGEQTIGWIHVFKAIRIESKPFIEIGGLVVDENYRGKGIGKSLVNRAKEWCIHEGSHKLRVRCNTKRLETHKFYSKLGFNESKEQKVFELSV